MLQRGASSRPHSARSVLEAGSEREPDPSLDFVRMRRQRRMQEAAQRDATPNALSTQASCGSFVPSEPPVALNGPHAVRLTTRQRKPGPFKTTPSTIWPPAIAWNGPTSVQVFSDEEPEPPASPSPQGSPAPSPLWPTKKPNRGSLTGKLGFGSFRSAVLATVTTNRCFLPPRAAAPTTLDATAGAPNHAPSLRRDIRA